MSSLRIEDLAGHAGTVPVGIVFSMGNERDFLASLRCEFLEYRNLTGGVPRAFCVDRFVYFYIRDHLTSGGLATEYGIVPVIPFTPAEDEPTYLMAVLSYDRMAGG